MSLSLAREKLTVETEKCFPKPADYRAVTS